MRKKLSLILITMTVMVMTANAQTLQQVCKKSVAADNILNGFKCKMTVKMVGIGESFDYYYYNKQVRMVHGEESEFIVGDTSYEVDTKEKTITMSTADEMDKVMLLMPFVTVEAMATDEGAKKMEKEADAKMKKKSDYYLITLNMKGQKAEIEIDAKTYHVKSMKMKKSFITVFSMSYSNIAPFHNEKYVKYDQKNYVGYKIKDERDKKKSKKSKKK